MKDKKEAVILVGHGGVPSDLPRVWLGELRNFEAQRKAQGLFEMSPREAELDTKIRQWPRTPQTEPYKFGLEALAQQLRRHLKGRPVVLAYNEFCAPSLQEAAAALVNQGYQRVIVLTTMITPGGAHSETEIPKILQHLQQRYPGIEFIYAWPYSMDEAAAFFAAHLKSFHDRV